MSNLSDKFTNNDFNILNKKLNTATCQLLELKSIINKLDESDIYMLLESFDGISRTAGMLNDICNQLLNDDYITTYDPMAYIHSKSDLSFEFLDNLCAKYSLKNFND